MASRLALTDRLAELAARANTPTRLVKQGREPDLPIGVQDAFVDSVHEALRNVDRHSQSDSATITIQSSAAGANITVTDHGRGFDVKASAPGYGLRESVCKRIEEVGGSALVTSELGSGTTVQVSWPAVASGSLLEQTKAYVPQLRTMVILFSLPLVAGHLYHLVSTFGRNEHAWAVPFLAAYLLILLGLCIRAIDHGFQVVFWLVAISSPVVIVAGVWAAGPGTLPTSVTWEIGFVNVLLCVVAIAVPWQKLLAVLAVDMAVVAALAVIDPQTSLLSAAMPILMVLVFPGIFAYTGWRVRLLGRLAQAQEAQAAEARYSVQQDQSRLASRWANYRGLSHEVLPFLEKVALGSVVPSKEQPARRTAGLLALAVRDEMAMPGVLDADARQALRAARGRGCEVVLRASDPDMPVAIDASELSVLVTRVVAQCASGTVTFVVSPQGCRVVAEPAIELGSIPDGLVRWSVADDSTEEATIVTVTFSSESYV